MTRIKKIRASLAAATWVLATVMVAALPSSASPLFSYNLVRDFSIGSNPDGAWSYGWTSPLSNQGRFNVFTATDSYSVPGMSAWRDPAPYQNAPPFIAHNDTQATICARTYCVPPNYLQLVPGPGATYSVVRWTAPLAGLVTIRATYRDLDQVGPTNVDVHVLLNSYTSLMSGQISKDHSPFSFQLAVKVAAGDTIDFAVRNAGNPAFDSTGLQGTITLAPCGPCQ